MPLSNGDKDFVVPFRISRGRPTLGTGLLECRRLGDEAFFALLRGRRSRDRDAAPRPCQGSGNTGGIHQESAENMKKKIIATALAAITGLGFASAAVADQATASVNVRSGPSTQYRVVDVLYPGEEVNIETCRSNGWCLIEHSGPDGWVSARYLSNDGDDFDSDDRIVRRSPNVTFSFSFGRGNGISIGTPPRGSSRDLVCLVTFFNRSDVAGGADNGRHPVDGARVADNS
jgi:hypothetical protein